MNFQKVLADSSVKKLLQDSISKNRVSHAQLFVGKPGWGTLDMAIAYAEAVLCNEQTNCTQKVQNLNHPDLHFSIPTFSMDKKKAITQNYIQEFKNLIRENHFANSNDWYSQVEAGNKQGFLSKDEIVEVMHTLSLKSYEGGYKVMIIWNADKMKVDYANKFLKLLEEPPEKTLFLLLTEKAENMLDTITSRCLSVNFKPLAESQVAHYAQEVMGANEEQAKELAKKSEGDIRKLQSLMQENEHRSLFEKEFIEWTRNSAMVLKNLNLLQNIIEQGERIATWDTEKQKQYLRFCMETFRSALMKNYQATELQTSPIESEGFRFDAFSTFVSGNNIESIIEELNKTYYYIERNANKKLVFTTLGIKLTRFIQKH